MGAPLDLLLRGGTVVDGTGAPARRADIGVRAGRITLLPTGAPATALTTLDVTGRTVTPGFIDVHTHSDALAVPQDTEDPSVETLRLAPLLQGVTTEIAGNCGSSLFPALPERLGGLAGHLRVTFGLGPLPPAADFTAFAAYQAPRCAPPISRPSSATAPSAPGSWASTTAPPRTPNCAPCATCSTGPSPRARPDCPPASSTRPAPTRTPTRSSPSPGSPPGTASRT